MDSSGGDMSAQFYLSLLNPIIALSFAIVVALLWRRWPNYTHFFPLSVAFLYLGLGFITQEWPLFAAPGGINYAGNALFFGAVVLACASALIRVGAKVPVIAFGAISFVALAAFLYFALITPSTAARIVWLSMSFVAFASLTIQRLVARGASTLADRLFIAALIFGGVMAAIRPVLMLAGVLPLNSEGGVDGSTYWESIAGLTPLLSILVVAIFLAALFLEIVAGLKSQADHDHLTGLFNRRGFEAAAAGPLAGQETGLALLIADIDDFKQVNDQFGHSVGDRVIAEVGAVLASHGEADFVGRIGGEEFALFYRKTSETTLQYIARAIAEALQQRHIPGLPAGYPLTVSIGLHQRQGEETLAEMQRLADRALYRAKADGKNRAVASPARLRRA